MGRRSDHSRAELRDMALEAARDIVKEEGIQKLSARAVASRIGYSAGTLYLIFHNLDDLLSALNAQTVADLRARIEAVANATPDPRERLRAIAHEYLFDAVKNPELFRLAFEHTAGPGTPAPEVIAAQTAAIVEVAVGTLGELLPGANLEQRTMLAAVLWSGIHGICHLGLTNKLEIVGQLTAEAVLDRQVEVFLNGIS